jgi:hypothetical protein
VSGRAFRYHLGHAPPDSLRAGGGDGRLLAAAKLDD